MMNLVFLFVVKSSSQILLVIGHMYLMDDTSNRLYGVIVSCICDLDLISNCSVVKIKLMCFENLSRYYKHDVFDIEIAYKCVSRMSVW